MSAVLDGFELESVMSLYIHETQTIYRTDQPTSPLLTDHEVYDAMCLEKENPKCEF